MKNRSWKKVMAAAAASALMLSGTVFAAETESEGLQEFTEAEEEEENYMTGDASMDNPLNQDEIVDKGETPYDFSKEELVKLCSQVITHLQRKLTATEERLDRYIEAYAEKKDIIKEQNSLIKKQQKTIEWVTTPFLKKVIRKLKNMFKG